MRRFWGRTLSVELGEPVVDAPLDPAFDFGASQGRYDGTNRDEFVVSHTAFEINEFELKAGSGLLYEEIPGPPVVAGEFLFDNGIG